MSVSRILSKSSVEKDLRHLDKTLCRKLMDKISTTLLKNPTFGKQLKGQFSGLRSFRIGNYRVIYELIPDAVVILRIAHRKESYR